MKRVALRAALLEEKEFLKSLYKTKRTWKILKKSSPRQLSILIQVLNQIKKGTIGLSPEAARKLKKRGKIYSLHLALDSQERIDSVLSGTKATKLCFLKPFSAYLQDFLYRLFFAKDHIAPSLEKK